jgi:hypothetical protein
LSSVMLLKEAMKMREAGELDEDIVLACVAGPVQPDIVPFQLIVPLLVQLEPFCP